MGRGPIWTEQEDAILRLLYDKGGYKAVRDHLAERTRGAILQRAAVLGLTRPATGAAPKMTLTECATRFAGTRVVTVESGPAPMEEQPEPSVPPPHEALRLLRVLTDWICRQPAGVLAGADRADVRLALTRARGLINGAD